MTEQLAVTAVPPKYFELWHFDIIVAVHMPVNIHRPVKTTVERNL